MMGMKVLYSASATAVAPSFSEIKNRIVQARPTRFIISDETRGARRMKRPKSTQEDELDARIAKYVQGIENRHRKDIEVLENRLVALEDQHQKDIQELKGQHKKDIQELKGQHQTDIQELKDQLRVSRFHTRSMAYFSMLNTYMNILKFAVKDEPDAKKRRISKRFALPMHVAEAHRFGEMLETHKQMGDTLDSKETLFLDVFSKIDALCAKGIGNLRF